MPVGALALLVSSSFGQNPQEQDQPARLIDSLQGASLYKAYCPVCHGSDAKGIGPMSKSLRSAPPDLTRITARNGGSFPVARVRNVISGGEALGAGHGTREMPVWGPIFSQVGQDQDLDAFALTTWQGTWKACRRSSFTLPRGATRYLSRAQLMNLKQQLSQRWVGSILLRRRKSRLALPAS
jgi:mono/diheme cytochrome c family protein